MVRNMWAIRKLIRKVHHKYDDLQDKYLTRSLARGISQVGINNANVVYLFSTPRHFYHEKLYMLVAYELAKRGLPSCFIFNNEKQTPVSPELFLDGSRINTSLRAVDANSASVQRLKNRIRLGSDIVSSSQFERVVDLVHREIRIGGLDFFPLIQCTIRTIQKRYNIDFTDGDTKRLTHQLVESCELALHYFYLLREYAVRHDKQMRICGWESGYIPNSVFAMLCKEVDRGVNIQYVDLDRGYMHYFGAPPVSSFISAGNLTVSDVESRHVVTQDELNRFVLDRTERQRASTSIDKALSKSFVEERDRSEKNRIIDLICEYRSQGRKVFVLFAHLFYDTPVDDSSRTFSGMCEWITETVQFFRSKEDLLLLKPHPVENSPNAPHREPNETLRSFLEPLPRPMNVEILSPSLFDIRDIAPLMSCGLIWRSSVGLELTYLRTPCIIAGSPPYRVLDLYYAKSRRHYFESIEKADQIAVSDSQVADVIRYLYYFKQKKHFYIRQLQPDSMWNREYLRQYLSEGDRELEELVDKILEIT